MKAVRIHEYGGPEKLMFEPDVPDPPLDPASILIQAVASSVNPIDYWMQSGRLRDRMPLALPAVLGRDASGEVVAVGQGVTELRVGAKVLGLVSGAYAEYVKFSCHEALRLPSSVKSREGAAVEPLAVGKSPFGRKSCQKGVARFWAS